MKYGLEEFKREMKKENHSVKIVPLGNCSKEERERFEQCDDNYVACLTIKELKEILKDA